jgi:hypothetical protein
MKKLTKEDKKAMLYRLQKFLSEKSSGAEVSADLIFSFLEMIGEESINDQVMADLRTQLKDVRDGADFALRQLKDL